MNRLRLAQQGFESLGRSLATALDEATSDRVEAWLRKDVCPVAEELSLNRSFRLTTRWSLDHLSPGVDTAERSLVMDVDRALVQCAAGLASVLRNDEQPGEEPTVGMQRGISESYRATLDLIASRPWFDLVCPEEFFHPYRDLHLNDSNTPHTTAFRQRELRVPLGDYVARSMFARIDYWKTILDRCWDGIFLILPRGTEEADRAAERLFIQKMDLDRAVIELKGACHQGPASREREACTTLTLVYAAYSPKPYLDWLGCPPSWWETSAPLIRSCIRRSTLIQIAEPGPHGTLRVVDDEESSLCDPDTVRQIAGALHDGSTFYEAPEDPDDLIKWAHGYARLVLVDHSPRQVYWDSTPIGDELWDKHSVQWNLLWTLAQNPGHVVDQHMLQNPTQQLITSRRSRLSKLLNGGGNVDALIVNVRGQGYRLDLGADDIMLLQDMGLGRLEVVGSRRMALI